jgi:Sec-independent protein translocase protein TatA
MNFSFGQLLFLLILAILLFGDVSKITKNIANSMQIFKNHFDSLDDDKSNKNKGKRLK